MPRLRGGGVRRGRRLFRRRGRDPDAGGLHGRTDPAGRPGQEGALQAVQRGAARRAEQVRLLGVKSLSPISNREHSVCLPILITFIRFNHLRCSYLIDCEAVQ